MVLWDTEHYPDYQMFLEVAQKIGRQADAVRQPRIRARAISTTSGARWKSAICRATSSAITSRACATCARTKASPVRWNWPSTTTRACYVYEVQPDWYEEFLSIEDEIMMTRMADEDVEDDDSLGGYFSKN